ncbi:hypothetical protein FA95DRAFT_1657962 [Auriscalpium vulgare]|uniref:Uncharacterized protein n=1 Tax=Auriscalpium vulgare TaxID=40419 RepID=A0ACB8R4N3_9AGAM|nr:hypothetical protein FA95DRAFT_1657962 [Auriscalpium vulgare]
MDEQDFPLLSWIPLRDEYLDEVLRLEGRGPYATANQCPRCTTDADPSIRCSDCVGGELLCVPCILKLHSRNPLHRVEKWNRTAFERVSLASLGLRIQLGHPPGTVCGHREPARSDFVVIHTNGIHIINLDFCGCGLSSTLHRRQQLLRFSWWPATAIDPNTAATFAALKKYHLLSLTGKLTGYDAWRTLELETDNTGSSSLPDRLPSWMVMIREWRHIAMMKRGGRGHDATGVAGTADGELAVQCPACPLPGINLPESWEAAPSNRAWLYRPIVAMDANFRMKNRMRSSKTKDPGLHTGKAYFVPDDKYDEHVAAHIDQEEISGCSRFAALTAANLKSTKGLRVTGVGAIFDARHDFWLPNGLGDLQKGERYCNMDYMFFSSISRIKTPSLLVSYDIACQWHKNLPTRAATHPDWNLPDDIDFAVPKFHIAAHQEECQEEFDLAKKRGTGQTDGEGPERGWSNVNGAAASTKEMGPGGRHDTVDDHCGHANWRKIVGLGSSLLRRMKAALLQATEQGDIYTEFTKSLELDHPEKLAEWREQIHGWEMHERGPNPYKKPVSGACYAVRIIASMPGFDNANTSFRLKLRLDKNKDRDGTSNQAARVQESRTSILRLLHRFRADQDVHMHHIASIINVDESTQSHNTLRPEHIKLYLPSDLSERERAAACDPTLSDMEAKFRYAGACQALDDVRHQLRFRTYVKRFKINNVVGQRKNTRARTFQSRIDDAVHRAAATYRLHRAAYLRLVGPGAWEKRLRELLDEHLVGLGERLLDQIDLADIERVKEYLRSRRGPSSTGESRYTLPWIWYTAGGGGEDEEAEIGDDLKLEWFKTRARSTRWMEEVLHLLEEMRRVPETFKVWAREWGQRSTARSDIPADLAEGLAAYACKHVAMYDALRERFTGQWESLQVAATTFLSNREDDGMDVCAEAAEPMMVN